MNHHPRARSLIYTMRQFGFDPIRFIGAIKALPRYLVDRFHWSQQRVKNTQTLASFHDRTDSAGTADGHYFWQDLIVAKWIFLNKPSRHLDVGSRVDGFVAHLLSFREIDVLDIREIESKIPGLSFIQGDAMSGLKDFLGAYDSVSSLHSIEHFGLGRYGDALSKSGHIDGLRNIANCVAENGHLYISFPLGEDLTQFNTQRLLNPTWAIKILPDFKLLEYVEIPWKGSPKFYREINNDYKAAQGSAGVYHLQRISFPSQVIY